MTSPKLARFALIAAVAACTAAMPTFAGSSSTDSLPILWPATATKNDATGLLAQTFGEIGDASPKYHTGLDIRADLGTVVVAAASGWLVELQPNDGQDGGVGNTIVLGHVIAGETDTLYTQYSHLNFFASTLETKSAACALLTSGRQARLCKPGQVAISRGDELGEVGGSGYGNPAYWIPHLHFEVKRHSSFGFGYSAAYPESDPIGYLDPLTFLHAPLTPGIQTATIERLGYKFFMGPGGYTGPNLSGSYRAQSIAGLGTTLSVLGRVATTAAYSQGCSGDWLKVSPPSPVPDTFDPDPGPQGKGQVRDSWICEDATLSESGTILVTSSPFNFGPSDLYVVDVSSSAGDRYVGRLYDTEGLSLSLLDIAEAPNGTLWGLSASRLYQIDTKTLTAFEAPALDLTIFETPNALEFTESGTMVSATSPGGDIITINPATGHTVVVGVLGTNTLSQGDIVSGLDGNLYASANASGASVLIRISPGTYAAQRVGNGIGFANVFGLAVVGGQMYGLTGNSDGSGQLIRIDPQSGMGTLMRTLSFPVYGATTLR